MGLDLIYLRVLKQFVRVVVLIFIVIFNKLLYFVEVLEDWKKVNVVLIFKKGECYNVENYCFILFICIVLKIMEYILIKYIMKYLEFNNILYKF